MHGPDAFHGVLATRHQLQLSSLLSIKEYDVIRCVSEPSLLVARGWSSNSSSTMLIEISPIMSEPAACTNFSTISLNSLLGVYVRRQIEAKTGEFVDLA